MTVDAFIATGAVGDVKVDGLECTDGGHASGAKMTNLFQASGRVVPCARSDGAPKSASGVSPV